VTVEAGNSDTENGYTHFVDGRGTSPSPVRRPVNRRRERTTTTTIPVKGLSDSEEETVTSPKRGRGRPRKSAGTPVPVKKRSSTPVKRNRRKSFGSLVDGSDENDHNFQLGQGVEVGRGKGRSRSRSLKGASQKCTPAPNQQDPLDKAISSTAGKKGRGRRKTLMPDEVVVLEDATSTSRATSVSGPLGDLDDALGSIDGNAAYPPSEYSTIRSTTTIGCSEPDVTLARFDPGNETPRRPGWSSPRVLDALQPSSPPRKSNGHSSPCISSTRAGKSQYGEDRIGMLAVLPETPGAYEDQPDEVHDCGEEDADEVGDLREFDTILESEGFSMISVDSVPSLRDHLSSPTNQNPEPRAKSPYMNKNLHALNEAAGKDDSFSSIPEEVLEAATPGTKAQNSKLLSLRNTRVDDSFSSIPPDVLEAATPARNSKLSKLGAAQSARLDDSFSSIASEILEAATPGRDLPKTKTRSVQSKNGDAYEDSFSAIPSTDLEAATPAPTRHATFKPGRAAYDVGAPATVDVQNLNQSRARNQRTEHDTSRLPTPDETPSPPTGLPDGQSSEPSGKIQANSTNSSTRKGSGNGPSLVSQIRSSPPSIAPRRYTYTAHLRQQRTLYPDETQTPSIVFSSPSLPPPIQFVNGHPILGARPEQGPRPTLSPTVRAGRALQGIVIPLSPRGRAQSLGSPFKSPVMERKSSSSAARDANPSPIQEGRVKPLPKLDLSGKLFPGGSKSSRWNSAVHHDDPFSNNAPVQQRSPSPEEKQSYTLGLPEQRRLSDPRLSMIQLEGDAMQHDDDMSWQSEEEIALNDATTSLVNNINLTINAEGSSSGQDVSYPNIGDSTEVWEQKWAAERAAVSREIAAAGKDKVVVIESEDEDEDLGLLLETLNSSSPAIQPRLELRTSNLEKPRRSKIPSPWRKNSRRLVYTDELSHLSSPPVAASVLSAKPMAKEGIDDLEADLSEYVIPQKANFNPRVRESGNLDLSALLASSPDKMALPVLTKSSQNISSLSKKFSSCNTSTADHNKENGPQTQSLAPIPQKMGFQPRIRDTKDNDASSIASSPVKGSTSTLNGIFGVHPNKRNLFNPTPDTSASSSSVQPLGLSTPSRTNTLRNVTRPKPPEHSSPPACNYDSNSSSLLSNGDKENQVIDNRTVKWTETVRLASVPIPSYTSPTKSCLRSPIKTPSAGPSSGSGSSASPTKNVTFVSSSPMPSSPTTEPLSCTTWSREHWLLLDSIIQSWKPENQTDTEEEKRRRNSTRVISNLLGKNVHARGEKMKLQQWHLEVVDEFRGYVPGWQEAEIAKRVFACLVDEERRVARMGGRREGEGEGMF